MFVIMMQNGGLIRTNQIFLGTSAHEASLELPMLSHGAAPKQRVTRNKIQIILISFNDNLSAYLFFFFVPH